MNTDLIAPVVAYCAQEVMRQGHNTTRLNGIWRVSYMLDAWCEALEAKGRNDPLGLGMIEMWGRLVEPDLNADGFRTCHVVVGGHRCPPPERVFPLLTTLIEQKDVLAPWDFYRGLLEIHPFRDGNGRTGKIVVNFLLNALMAPVFPPADFWGHPIQNP